MPWNHARSERRIREHLKTVPAFDEQITLAQHRRVLVEARKSALMDRLPVKRAFVVEGAHLYGELLDFDTVVADRENRETEASHTNVLRFLNMHYRIWDAIVENDDADRVDYHGTRLHSIVTDPDGDPRGQVERAVALAAKLAEASQRLGAVYGFPARIRFGVAQGKCLAMTTGRALEKDTLFLGAPANHAAKAAAGGDEPGIFLAPTAEHLVGASAAMRTTAGTVRPTDRFVEQASTRYRFDQIDTAVAQLSEEAVRNPEFRFHRARPPLSGIKFADLFPSNSIRMGMASVFADIDGFTAFVDGAIGRGSEAIKKAATSIHVIREELNDVLGDDFEGKRVRFIGDCIQGVLAIGAREDEPTKTVRTAALCAAGMRSSFSLCQKLLGGIDELDLAIGVEYGPVPLTRIGQPGKESVRCAAGRAVIVSERMQESIEGGGIRFGPAARAHADRTVEEHFAEASTIVGYDAAADLLGETVSPAVSIVREDRSARPYLA